MRVLNIQDDERSKCKSVLTIMSLADYKKIAYNVFLKDGNLDGQRGVIKRSSSANKIRKRMNDDFSRGAIFPQVVLGVINLKRDFIENETFSLDYFDTDNISIIDGMQRSNVYFNNYQNNEEKEVRVEFWVAEESVQLLYRMLVLNTGQMPWTTRRQIEVIYGSLSKNIITELDTYYPELDGKINIFGVDESKQRVNAGKYKKSDIIEAYLAFNVRKVKINVSEELADEYQRFDMLETIENPKAFEYFVRVLGWLFKFDLIFEKFTYTNDDMSQFKCGKDIFRSSTAIIGFVVASVEYIMGKSSIERAANIQEEKMKELIIRFEKISDIINNKCENDGEESQYLSLDVLNDMIDKLPKGRIGDEMRRLFKNSFDVMIKYDELDELPSLGVIWSE